jgi:hypothetical protein
MFSYKELYSFIFCVSKVLRAVITSSSVDQEISAFHDHSTVTWRVTALMVPMKLAAVSTVGHIIISVEI